MPLYNTILNRAPLSPVDIYALAGVGSLEHLAVATSSYFLHLKLQVNPDKTWRRWEWLTITDYTSCTVRAYNLWGMLDSPMFPPS